MTASLEALKHIFYIKYSIQFQAQQVKVLVNSDSEMNAMNPTFAAKIDLSTQSINVGAQKIDAFVLKTYDITIV